MRPGVIGGMGAAIAAAVLAFASIALAVPRPPGQELSPRLAALAKSEALRTAPPRKQAARLDVAPAGEGSLLRYGERLVVEVLVAGDPQDTADGLRAAGAEVLGVSPNYGIVTAAVAPASLQEVANAPGVEAVTEQLTPATSQVGPAGLAGGGCAPLVSEGDEQLRADDARTTYPIAGQGVEVGILSDSFDAAPGSSEAADVASGDLPGPGNPCGRTTPVDVLQDLSPANDPLDEGRAMAQIVHDLAPGAQLSFATGFTGLTLMAKNVRRLADAGADVIVDDVTWPDEPFFQAGPIDNAIEAVTANGVVYYSSAGNSNAPRPSSQFGSWEAPQFRPTGDCPALSLPAQEDCLDFEPAAGGGANLDRGFELTVADGGALQVVLQWAEPWYGVQTDLDLYLVDATNDVLADSVLDNVSRDRPAEGWFWQNNTGSAQDVRIVVNRASGARVPRVKLRAGGASFGITSNEYADPDEPDLAGPTIMGHNGAQDALSVAAVRYDDGNLLEPFSSHGPVTHYIRPVNGTVPAQPRPSPLVLSKPDIAATDGARTTFFGPPPFHRFFGTSAAAPHAAAVAALQLDATPRATPGQIGNAQAATATPVGAFGELEAGAGLVDALAAVERDNAGPTVTLRDQPNRRSTKRKATFKFQAEARASYQCKLDGQAWKSCVSPETYKVKRGTHHFRVRATDQLGNIGPFTKYKWRRVRR
jgi:hypothetical protein